MVKTKLWVTVNERNLRIGESHPRAVLTDHDVEMMLELRDEGFSYRWLAVKFEVSLRQAYRICTGMQRGQIPATRRRVTPRETDQGITAASLAVRSALSPGRAKMYGCMEILHSGINKERPTSEMTQVRPGWWVCATCVGRIERQLAGKARSPALAARGVSRESELRDQRAKKKTYQAGVPFKWWKE